MKFITVTALACALVAGTAAAETWSGGAIAHGTNTNTMAPVSETHVVMQTSGMYDRFEVAPGHPLEDAAGSCFGAVEMKAGEVEGGGRCVYDTASGDKAVMVWMATGLSAAGALTGDWSISGGSGAWAEASGGGTFSSLTDPATGAFVNTITGDIVMD